MLQLGLSKLEIASNARFHRKNFKLHLKQNLKLRERPLNLICNEGGGEGWERVKDLVTLCNGKGRGGQKGQMLHFIALKGRGGGRLRGGVGEGGR